MDIEAVQQSILARLSSATQEAVPFTRVQQELNVDPKLTAAALRGLLEGRRVTLRRSGNETYISLSNDLTENLALVLDAVRASGTSGIDQLQLMAKVRLPKSELLKALNALLAKRHIQECRSFTNRAKRIYLLHNLEPSHHVTGGTFYCGEELDVAFVDELRRRMVAFVEQRQPVTLEQLIRFIEAESVPQEEQLYDVDQTRRPSSPITLIHSSGSVTSAVRQMDGPCGTRGSASFYGGGATADQSFASAPLTAVCHKRISPQDIQLLVQSLVLDGVLEMWDGGASAAMHAGGSALAADKDVSTSYSPPLQNAPARETSRYCLGVGINVMRHFTAQPRRLWDGQGQHSSGASGSDGAPSPPGQARTEQHASQDGDIQRSQQMRALVCERSAWVPAPVTRPTTYDAWPYLPALGYPCLGCPQLANCSADGMGLINPATCAYLREWLS